MKPYQNESATMNGKLIILEHTKKALIELKKK
jgi:hypothetical protein